MLLLALHGLWSLAWKLLVLMLLYYSLDELDLVRSFYAAPCSIMPDNKIQDLG